MREQETALHKEKKDNLFLHVREPPLTSQTLTTAAGVIAD